MCVVSSAPSMESDGRVAADGLQGAVRRYGSGESGLRSCATLTTFDSWEADEHGGWVHSTTSVALRRSRHQSASPRLATAA